MSHQINVGSGRTIKTIDVALVKAQAGDTILLDAPETFNLATHPLIVSKNVTIRSANDQRPTIAFQGHKDQTAIGVGHGVRLELDNVNFTLSPGVYAISTQGDITSSNVDVFGGGGCHSIGAGNITLANWTLHDENANYHFYFGPLTTVNNATAFVQRPTLSVTLDNVQVLRGVKTDHVLRVHNVNTLRINNCHLIQPQLPGCSARVHNCGNVYISNSTLRGDCSFGPMDGGDGGIKLPPGPQRNFQEAQRLNSLLVENTVMDTDNCVRVAAGILQGRFHHCAISNKNGNPVWTPPYWTWPASVVSFDDCTFTHAGAKGVFTDLNGAKLMTATNCKFNGQPFTK